LLSVGQMRARPRPSWRVKPLILSTGLCIVYGASGAGKTFAVIDLALSIVRGIPWFDHRVKQGRVCVFRSKSITDSGANWTPIPVETGQ
jgi:hypothetical protein